MKRRTLSAFFILDYLATQLQLNKIIAKIPLISSLAAGLLFCSNSVFAQNVPNYNTIKHQFLAEYQVGLVNNSSRIIFEKKPEGWYVRQVEFFPDPQTAKHELWWDATKHHFNKLSFSTQKFITIEDSIKVADLVEIDNSYDWFPYYGYRGWERDALEALELQLESATKHLTISLCYASLANSLVHNDPFVYDGIKAEEISSKEKREAFLAYHKLARTNLEKAVELDSNYLYHDVNIKEHLRMLEIKQAVFLGIYFEEHQAISQLSPSLFHTDELAYYRNILISCPLNAVLFATGDIDVLPLYFLMFNLNERKDVILVNRDWIEETSYQHYLEKMYSDSSIFSSVTTSLSANHVDFVRVLKYNRIRQRPFPGQSLATQKVRMDGLPDNSYQVEDFDLAQEYVDLKYLLQFVSQEVNNQMDNGLTRFNYFPTDGVIVNTKTSLIRWKIENKLLNRSDLIFFDIINQNIKKRPICVVSSTPKDMLLSIDDFQLRGLVYELVDDQHATESGSDQILISSELMYENLMYQFYYGDPSSTSEFQYQMYWTLFYELVNDLAHRDKFNGALNIVNLYFKVFLKESWKDARSPMLLAEYYYVFQKFDEANDIMRMIHQRINNKDFPNAELSDYQRWLEQLQLIVKNYKQEEEVFQSK